MTRSQKFIKRAIDICTSLVLLLLLWPIIVIAGLAARFDTGQSGIFRQTRVGLKGKHFTIYKIRTMRFDGEASGQNGNTHVSTSNDTRITSLGGRLRRWKIDELPQLWNVLKGDMSLVGPRPDVPGYADRLEGIDRIILDMRPGITGPATLKYRDEEFILSVQEDPVHFNDTVVWPDKLKINRSYYLEYNLMNDFRYIWQTLFGV